MKEEIPQLMLEKNKVYSKIMRRVSSPMGIITDTNIMKYSNIHNNLHKPSSNHQKSSSLLIGGSKQSAALKRQIMSYAPSSDISLICNLFYIEIVLFIYVYTSLPNFHYIY